MADLIFESLSHLSLQFTEAVIQRTQERIQGCKLNHVTQLITLAGEDEGTRTQLRTTAEKVLRQVVSLKEIVNTMGNAIDFQTATLNKLCRTNGFTTQEKNGAYEMFEMSQTTSNSSLKSLNNSKLNYIEELAELFAKNNKEDFTPAIVRYSTFFGGKDS